MILVVRRRNRQGIDGKGRFVEGVAIHNGPESCAVTREGKSEALTGVRTGQPLSRERSIVSGADMVTYMESNTDGRAMQAHERPGVVADPGMCRHSLSGNREVSWLTKAACRDWSASGRREAEADDARPREVRLRHSSGEVAEQNRGTGSGGDGAKDGGRGEREPATHAPDTEPGKRVTDAGARTDGRKVLPSLCEVGAGCGKAARPVLCVGRIAICVPTAILISCPLTPLRIDFVPGLYGSNTR